MSEQILRGVNNEVIGFLETKSDGQQQLFRANKEILGHFDPRSNITRNANMGIVGHGNLLMMLLR